MEGKRGEQMKRLLKTALMTMVFAVLLCVGALAAESGIYDLTLVDDDFTVAALDADGKAVTPKSEDLGEGIGTKELCAGAVKVKVTYDNAKSNTQYLVFALNDNQGVPKEGNIAYIDQNGEAEFMVYPTLDSSKTYSIYVTSNGSLEKTLVATFKYYQDGMPGDVDLNEKVDMDDVVALLRHVLKAEIITNSTALKNGEVVDATALNMDDVVKLLRYVLKADDSL